MGYNPTTGQWEPEDASVSKKLTGLLSSNNKYMQQAGTEGRKAANRRGLLNSSIAVGAVEDARIRAALPIASQEAGQIHQSNLQGTDIASRERMQGRQFEHETGLQGTDIESRERMQGVDVASRERMQGLDITSREGMQEAELTSLAQRQQADIASREQMQLTDIASREGMQAAQLSQLNDAQVRDIASREGMQAAELQSLIDRQATDIASREGILALDRELQDRIAQMNVSAGERQQAAALAASFEQSYSNLLSSIMSNPDIPASSRQTYMNHAARVRESNFALIEQMFGISLEWGASAQPIAASTTPTAALPPPSATPTNRYTSRLQ